jgi:hypothetical protein
LKELTAAIDRWQEEHDALRKVTTAVHNLALGRPMKLEEFSRHRELEQGATCLRPATKKN